MSGGTPGTGDAAASDDRRPGVPGMGSQRSGPRSAEQRPRRQGQADEQAPTLTRRGRCEGSRLRRGCRAAGAKGELDAAAESEHRRRRPPGIRFLLGQIPDRSPPAGRSLAECPARSPRHFYGAPKGAGGGGGGVT